MTSEKCPFYRTESEYQLRLKDNQNEEATAKMRKSYSDQLADQRQTIHKLQNDLEIGKRDHDNSMIRVLPLISF